MASRDLTQGPVPRLVAVLALPVFATFVLQSLYALADLYFVGRLGGAQLAALGISLNTFFLVLAVGQCIGTGGLALMAQAFGRGERASVPGTFQQVFWLAIGVGGLSWAAAWFFAEDFMRIFTKDPDVFRYGVDFFRIYAATFLTQLLIFAGSVAFRAVGDFIMPTIVMAGTVLLNVALDPLLIFGLGPVPGLGVAGAGWATFLAQAAGCVAYGWMVLPIRPGRILVLQRPFLFDWRVMLRILRIGVPAGVQFLLFTIAMMISFRFLRPFGAEAAAAAAIGFRVLNSAFFPGVAVGSSVSSVVGQNFGARRFSRVRSAMMWGAVYITIIFTLEYALILVNPPFWVSLFTDVPPIVRIGAEYLIISCIIMPVYGFDMVTTFASQGLGRTLPPLLAALVRMLATVGGLFALEAWWGLTLTRMFWVGTTAMLLEVLTMGIVMLQLWRGLLQQADGTASPASSLAGAPAPAPGAD